MGHRVLKRSFGRDKNEKKALLRSLVSALVEHGRIETTLTKCKELRRHAEKAITIGKKSSLHARRVLASRYPNPETVKGVFDDIAPRFKDRNGGYTRIVKTGRRPGDNAPMALIEWVDFTPTKKVKAEAGEKKAKSKEGAEASAAPAKKTAKKKAGKKVVKKKSTRTKKG